MQFFLICRESEPTVKSRLFWIAPVTDWSRFVLWEKIMKASENQAIAQRKVTLCYDTLILWERVVTSLHICIKWEIWSYSLFSVLDLTLKSENIKLPGFEQSTCWLGRNVHHTQTGCLKEAVGRVLIGRHGSPGQINITYTVLCMFIESCFVRGALNQSM